jgi:hypothetical protein
MRIVEYKKSLKDFNVNNPVCSAAECGVESTQAKKVRSKKAK